MTRPSLTKLRIKTVPNSNRLRHHNIRPNRCLIRLHLHLCLLDLRLQVIYLELHCLRGVPAPDLPSFRLIWNPMYRFLLLMVVCDTRRDLLLDETWVRGQEGQLTGIKHLLLLFDLIAEVHEALPVQGHEAQVLAREPLSFFADIEELLVDWLL